jgi:hypothetical protein
VDVDDDAVVLERHMRRLRVDEARRVRIAPEVVPAIGTTEELRLKSSFERERRDLDVKRVGGLQVHKPDDQQNATAAPQPN